MSSRRLRVLIVGHALAPGAGSEPGLTWNWARHLAVEHDVWVIAHPAHRQAVEQALAQCGAATPTIIWVNVDQRWDPWKADQGERGIHLHYMMWQRRSFAMAMHLHALHSFDIVHHVSWGTAGAPPMLWRLDVPFVWGPLGGGQAAPLRFARYLGMGTFKELARTLRLAVSPFMPPLRAAARHSALILVTNRETEKLLKRAGARDIQLFLDNGVLQSQIMARQTRPSQSSVELLWAGRLESRKGFRLALEAVSQVRHLPVRLTVAGDGPRRAGYEQRARSLGLDGQIRFLGMVPRARMTELFAQSDIFLFTSLQDAFGSVVIEAMAAGLPILTLDHQGVGAMIPPDAAIKVPVQSPKKTVTALVDAIHRLAASATLREQLGAAACAHADGETWPQRVKRMTDLYCRCLEK